MKWPSCPFFIINDVVVSLPIPRKGMETLVLAISLNIASNAYTFHYLFPARGWKREPSFFPYCFKDSTSFITYSPQGDGNQQSAPITTLAIATVSLPIPRKGMETKKRVLNSHWTFLFLFHYLFPARGWKQQSGKLRCHRLIPCFITYSPQGDGNFAVVEITWTFLCSFITYSPQGDGNVMAQIPRKENTNETKVSLPIPRKGMETWKILGWITVFHNRCFITYSPQGDGNLECNQLAHPAV